MASHVTNLATKYEDPTPIRSWVTSYNGSRWLALKMRTRPLRMRRITWPVSRVSKTITYLESPTLICLSLYNFYWATTTIKGRLRSSFTNAKALDCVNYLCVTLWPYLWPFDIEQLPYMASHVTNLHKFSWPSVKGIFGGGGQIFPSPIDFHRRPYNTLALPCECVMDKLQFLVLIYSSMLKMSQDSHSVAHCHYMYMYVFSGTHAPYWLRFINRYLQLCSGSSWRKRYSWHLCMWWNINADPIPTRSKHSGWKSYYFPKVNVTRPIHSMRLLI